MLEDLQYAIIIPKDGRGPCTLPWMTSMVIGHGVQKAPLTRITCFWDVGYEKPLYPGCHKFQPLPVVSHLELGQRT